MKVSEMCVRKKQVRPGVYKALCDGYIKVQAGSTVCLLVRLLCLMSICLWSKQNEVEYAGSTNRIVTGGLAE